MRATESWFSRGKAEAEKGIPVNERVVGIAIVVFSILMVSYFVAHQTRPTGFFTETFGPLEMLMLYGVWAFWIISAGLEGILGRRLLSRLFDACGGLIVSAIGMAWLLGHFRKIIHQIPEGAGAIHTNHFGNACKRSKRFSSEAIARCVRWTPL